MPNGIMFDTMAQESVNAVVVVRLSKASARTIASCKYYVGWDSQASFGVTNNLDLFGGRPLKTDITFKITDWANETKLVSTYGDTAFGPMIYTPEASGTILCEQAVYTFWDVKHEVDCPTRTITHKMHKDFSLQFSSSEDNPLSGCVLNEEEYSRLCGLANADLNDLSREMKISISQAISKQSLNLIMEAIRFHECSCHASLTYMAKTLHQNIFANCLICETDIYNILLINEFGCLACLLGKSKCRHTNPHRNPIKKREKLPVRRHEELTDEAIDEYIRLAGEILGLDLMFIRGRIYLVAVGKIYGYVHVVRLMSKSKGAVGDAIKGIIQDYEVNSKKVAAVFNNWAATQNQMKLVEHDTFLATTKPVRGTESDNEGAFLAAAIDFLTSLGIMPVFVPSGEHVGYVERAIQTIKTRVSSTEAGLTWMVEDKIQDWLVNNVVNWMNALYCAKNPKSAWLSLTGRRHCYRSLCMTKFGDIVVAHRSAGHLGDGTARGELGMSLGPMMNGINGIYFLSFTTMQVKARRRWVMGHPVSMMDHGFKKNAQYVGKSPVAAMHLEYLKSRPGLADPGSDWTEDLNVAVQGTYLNEHKSEESAVLVGDFEVGIPKVVPPLPPGPQPRRGDLDPVRDYEEYTRIEEERNRVRVVNDEKALARELILEEMLKSNDEQKSLIKTEVPSEPPPAEDPIIADELLGEAESKVESQIDEPLADPVKMKSSIRTQPSRRAKSKHSVIKMEGIRSVTVKSLRRTMKKNMKEAIIRVVTADGLMLCSVSKAGTTSWKKGTLKYGKEADAAITAELEQILRDYDACKPSRARPKTYHRAHDLFDVKADGRKKARLVIGKTVNGCLVDCGVDLYAPTIDMKVVKLLLSIGLEQSHEFRVWDVKGAFLKAPLDVAGVFVLLPKHIADRAIIVQPNWKDYLREDGSLMVECSKAWYGLSAAPALWNKEIHATLTEKCGYTQHSMVDCCYYKRVNGELCILMLHVDDLGVLMPPDNVEYDRVKNILEKKYECMRIQESDSVSYIGLEIHRNRENNTFELSMKNRVEEACRDFDIKMANKKPKNPSRKQDFSKADPEGTKLFDSVKRYRSLVMTIAYMTSVYPSVKFHAMFLATKQSCPSVLDWEKAVYLMQYIWSVRDEAMIVSGIGRNPSVNVYQDASFDIHADSKSHSGLAVFVGDAGCAIYCSSNKQHCITRSSTDAEIVAAESGVMIGSFIRDFCDELDIKMDVYHHEDNNSCICLVGSGTHAYDRKERHMIRRINFMHEYFEDEANRSQMVWCPTNLMTADALTKDLYGDLYEAHRLLLMGRGTYSDEFVKRVCIFLDC